MNQPRELAMRAELRRLAESCGLRGEKITMFEQRVMSWVEDYLVSLKKGASQRNQPRS